MHNLKIHKQAKKRLLLLPCNIRTKIAGAIQMLAHDPEDLRLDIKKLQGQTGFRMRIGQWRVIFEKDDAVKVISIEKIGARGDVYK